MNTLTTRTRLQIIGAVVVVVIIGFAVWHVYTKAPNDALSVPINTVSYACNEGKTITAAYYEGESVPATDTMPPIPGGSVALTLSDGRTFSLAQTISADGIRYANSDESFVFWSKGNGALVLENNTEKSYIGCVETIGSLSGTAGVKVYTNATAGYSVLVPVAYTADEHYIYQALGPGKSISGTKFTIPSALADGTNLSTDSYVSVETLPKAEVCRASLFLGEGAKDAPVTLGGKNYSSATGGDAGAGNRYQETVYALPGTNPCIAVRYFIHSTAIENYSTGTKTVFDGAALMAQFDGIRDTLTVSQ